MCDVAIHFEGPVFIPFLSKFIIAIEVTSRNDALSISVGNGQFEGVAIDRMLDKHNDTP